MEADMSKETLMGGDAGMDGMGEEPALDEEPALELEVTDSTVTTEEGM